MKQIPLEGTVIARISVTFSTLHSFISVKKFFDEHVYLTQNAHEPLYRTRDPNHQNDGFKVPSTLFLKKKTSDRNSVASTKFRSLKVDGNEKRGGSRRRQ